jgi:hypothetical protein
LQAESLSQTVESASDLAGIIEAFCNGNYHEMAANLRAIRSELHYDPYFGAHVQGQKIFQTVRRVALVDYVKAYKIISLDEIASEFGEPVDVIQRDLTALILSKKLEYRVDLHDRMVQKVEKDHKLAMLRDVAAKGDQILEQVNMNVLKAQLHL